MKILALDSASGACAACVWNDGVVLACREEKMARGQDARLIPLVLDILEQSGVAFPEIDRIAVTRGPGSFTGLRIGLAAARGLGLALAKPVIGIDRFSIYAAPPLPRLIVLESQRHELYTQAFFVSGACDEARLRTPEEIAAWACAHPEGLIVGDAQETLASVCGTLPCRMEPAALPEVVTCATLAAQAAPENPSFLPRPLYLRAPDVTIKCAVSGAE